MAQMAGELSAQNTGEIFPTDRVPILVPGKNGAVAVPMSWGFPRPNGGGVVINARSETVHEKAMFREPVRTGRCVVPTSGFYEWRREGKQRRERYRFRLPGKSVLYLAGLYGFFPGPSGVPVRRFVIVTTGANDSMRLDEEAPLSLFHPEPEGLMIHGRMPVVLLKEEFPLWFGPGYDVLFRREHILLDKQAI